VGTEREDGLTGDVCTVQDLRARTQRGRASNPSWRSYLRLAEPSDAAFIVKLRSDAELGRYLSGGAVSVTDQVAWLEQYAAREAAGSEAYFIIMHEGAPKGTVRIYDFLETASGPSFNWGSWIIVPPRPKGLAKASALYVYDHAFNALGLRRSHFEVLKENVAVIDFHLRTGATPIAESATKLFFAFDPSKYAKLAEAFADAWDQHARPA
jgi:RimJ/RimL family protein N-acetyltransferase